MTAMARPTDAHVDERLRTEPIVWLGSVRVDGRPHLVPVWFYWDGGTVLVFTKPGYQKVGNIRANPRVMLAVDDTKGGGDVVMVEGTAELLAQPTATVVPPAYFDKYADLIAGMGWSPASLSEEYTQAIRITPTRFINW